MLCGPDRIPAEVVNDIAGLVQSAKPAPDPHAKPGRPSAASRRHNIRSLFDRCELRELADDLLSGAVTPEGRERAARIIENRRAGPGQPPIEIDGLLVKMTEVKKLLIAASSKSSSEAQDRIEAAGLSIRKKRITKPSKRTVERMR
jgi:hypothetical protein